MSSIPRGNRSTARKLSKAVGLSYHPELTEDAESQVRILVPSGWTKSPHAFGFKLGGKSRTEHVAPHRNRRFETKLAGLGIEKARPSSPAFSEETITVLYPNEKSISTLNVIQQPNPASTDLDKTLVSKTLVSNGGL